MDILACLEGFVQRGEFIQAVREAGRLFRQKDSLTLSQRGNLYRLAGRARAEAGDPYGGLKVLELSIPLALRARDWDCAGKARAELGISWLFIGDFLTAIEYFQAYLLDLPRYDQARAYLGNVHYNLGLAYRRRWENERAIHHYREALEWFIQRGYTLQAAETHQNLAWLYCLEGNADDAECELNIAESFGEVCGPEFRIEQLVCRAFLFMITKRVGDAMQLVEEVFNEKRRGSTASHKAWAAWIAGSVALAICDFGSAQFFSETATKWALEAEDPGVMSQASILKAEIVNRKRNLGEAAI